MTYKPKPTDSRGEVVVSTIDEHFVITQKRAYEQPSGRARYTVSLTLEQAKAVVADLTRRIALADAINARDELLEAREEKRRRA